MKVDEVKSRIIIPVVLPVERSTTTQEFMTGKDNLGAEAKVQVVKPQILTSHSMPPPWLLNQFRYLFDVSPSVDPDLSRYNEILKGKAREELRKFRKPGEMIGVKGGKIVSIPVPIIDIPHFTKGDEEEGGVGSGDGDIGTPIGPPQPGPGGGAGDQPGEHIKEVWVPMTRSEAAKILIEDLTLPYLQPKGYGGAKEKSIKWNTYSRVGKDIDLIQTVKNVLARTGSEIGDKFDIDTEEGLNKFLEQVVVEEGDKVYISWNIVDKPQASLVIIYMMDVSGSMTDDLKERVRTLSWYMSTIIQYQFGLARADLRGEKYTDDQYGEGVSEIFTIHDAEAREVDEESYYTTRESGGTKVSTAFNLAEQIIKQRFNPALWNIYLFYFGDGDNWGEDNSVALELMERLKEQVNMIGYIQTDSPHGGDGELLKHVQDKFGENTSNLRSSRLRDDSKEEYRKVIVDMLGERKKE